MNGNGRKGNKNQQCNNKWCREVQKWKEAGKRKENCNNSTKYRGEIGWGEDIEEVIRIGKYNRDRTRPIISKFTTTRKKRKVMIKVKGLKRTDI